MKKLLVSALIFRIFLSFLTYHPDTLDFLGWTKDININGLKGIYFHDVADAGPANYPPLFYIYLNANNKIYSVVDSFLWRINLKVPSFPSGMYLLFKSDEGIIWFNKLTPILFDLGVGYLIYRIVGKYTDKKRGRLSSAFYLFAPPSWYVSSLWGQFDSMYVFFFLLSVYLILQKRVTWSMFFLTISLLIKPNSLFVLPVYLLYLMRYTKIRSVIYGGVASLMVIFLSGYYFIGNANVYLIVQFYTKYIREISGYISSNAFNFWGLFYGFGPKSDSVSLFGLELFWWGIFLYLVMAVYLLVKLLKKCSEKQLIISLLLISYGSFIFLTRMHERYFYLSYIFLIITAFVYTKLRKYLYIATGVFFLNLYHYWWYPYLDISKQFFSLRVTEILLCLVNLGVFYRILKFHIRETVQLRHE